MGLLATLPRATRGHLGASNNSLTRATRGYLQREGVVVRRPGGGLFAPEVQVEGYRRHLAVLTLMLDGNSRWRFTDQLETRETMAGRLWLSGQSTFRPGRETVPLRPFLPPFTQGRQPAPGTEQTEGPAAPPPTPAQERLPLPGEIRRRGTAGLVFALESRFVVGDPPAPAYRKGAGGTLWLAGASRFTLLDVGEPPRNQSDDEIAIIAALLAQEIDNG